MLQNPQEKTCTRISFLQKQLWLTATEKVSSENLILLVPLSPIQVQRFHSIETC